MGRHIQALFSRSQTKIHEKVLRGGGYWANFLRSVIFRIFQYYQNTRHLLKITFVFDRCRRSSAAVAPVKYKCDSNNLRSNFARSKILLTEKLTNGGLVTPTPGQKPQLDITVQLVMFTKTQDCVMIPIFSSRVAPQIVIQGLNDSAY